jgi:hypothetical protein
MNFSHDAHKVNGIAKMAIVFVLLSALLTSMAASILVMPIFGQAASSNKTSGVSSGVAGTSNVTSNNTAAKSLEKVGTVTLKDLFNKPKKFGSVAPGKIVDLEEKTPDKVSEKALKSMKEQTANKSLKFSSTSTAQIIELNIQKPVASTNNTNMSQSVNSSNSTLLTKAKSAPGNKLTASIGNSWEGLNINTGCGGGCIPPDVDVAASSDNFVIEVVNLAIQAWDKSGNPIGSASLSDFYGTGSDFVFDPKIVFDSVSGHWFTAVANAKQFDASGNPQCETTSVVCSILVAVSTTPNPLGTWFVYEFPFPNVFPDQPIIATSDDKLAISVNDFSSAFPGCAEVYAADKIAMTEGRTTFYYTSGANCGDFSIHPAQSLSPTACLFMVSTISPFGSGSVRTYNICGDPTTGVTFNVLSDIAMSPSAVPPSGREPAGLINTDDGRMQSAVYYAGKIWDGFNDACSVDGSTVQACSRVQKIDVTSLTLDVDTYIAASGIDTFYPAVTMNQAGDLKLIIGASGPDINPSLVVGGDNPWGFAWFAIGSTSITESRYGDYFGAGADPSGQSAWVAGEYGNNALPNHWSTFVGNTS